MIVSAQSHCTALAKPAFSSEFLLGERVVH